MMSVSNEHRVHPNHRLGWRGPTQRPVLNFSTYLTGAMPQYPPSVDDMNKVAEWNGSTNKKFGTCGPCSYANLTIMAYKYLAGEDITVSDDAIYAFYRASGNPSFDPATDADDQGVDNSIMLAAAQNVGLEITHENGSTEFIKPVAYGKLTGMDIVQEVRAATALFGGVIIGVTLDTAQQQQTVATPAVWDFEPSSTWGGHDIFGGAYTGSAVQHTADEMVVSWQKVVGMTDDFIEEQVGEVFAVILPIMLQNKPMLPGVDWPTLANDFQRLTGRSFPVPVPTPAPAPSVTDPDAALNDAFHAWAEAKGLTI